MLLSLRSPSIYTRDGGFVFQRVLRKTIAGKTIKLSCEAGMTNLVISNFISYQSVALSNVTAVTTNADGSTTVVGLQTGMRTLSIGPLFWPVVLLVVVLLGGIAFTVLRRKSE